MNPWITDCLPAVLILCGVAWHAWLLRKSENVEQLMASRRVWLRKVMGSPGHELLAVQTVRNSLMAASLMATTAALGVAGALSVGKEAGLLGHALSESLMGATALWGAGKTALLAGALTVAFLLFSLSVRFYHRVGYTLAGWQGEDTAVIERAASELMRGAGFYRAGWRAFYAALTAAAWFFGTWPMCVVAILALVLDHKVSE
jgi:uncharacterized membrane protein